MRRSYFNKVLREYLLLAQLDTKWRTSTDEKTIGDMFGETMQVNEAKEEDGESAEVDSDAAERKRG